MLEFITASNPTRSTQLQRDPDAGKPTSRKIKVVGYPAFGKRTKRRGAFAPTPRNEIAQARKRIGLSCGDSKHRKATSCCGCNPRGSEPETGEFSELFEVRSRSVG